MMTSQEKVVPVGFDDPTGLPQSAEQRAAWQHQNRQWWESNPMRYDWKDRLGIKEFSSEFYDEIDRRFFKDSEEYLPARKLPFDRLIPFDDLPRWDVLEIGVGNGSHAGLLARHARSYTGIDLTEYAVHSTSERLRLAGLGAKILRMDAEKMDFPDNSFDLIWSWGVIHHSSNTDNVLKEMQRVLKPGGRAIVMVYYRNFWNYWILAGLFHGLLRGMWFRTHSLHRIQQLTTDGALARFYTRSEWQRTVSTCFDVESIEIFGSKSHVVPLPTGRLKSFVLRCFPNWLSRFMNHTMRMGFFLVSPMQRRDDLPNVNASQLEV
jgi:ubiquinone/menaquinone biosynthesis C-methylase UbiE